MSHHGDATRRLIAMLTLERLRREEKAVLKRRAALSGLLAEEISRCFVVAKAGSA